MAEESTAVSSGHPTKQATPLKFLTHCVQVPPAGGLMAGTRQFLAFRPVSSAIGSVGLGALHLGSIVLAPV